MDLYSKVSISGKMTSGKTTMSDRLNREHGYKQIRSAQYLKELCEALIQQNMFELSGNTSPSINDKVDRAIWRLSNDHDEFQKIKIEVECLRKLKYSSILSFESKNED